MSCAEEVRVYEPVVYPDQRGLFYESYNEEDFNKWMGQPIRFVQDNHSISSVGVLRGLHYQLPPFAQAKLVRVTRGVVFDVVVDIRRSSAGFGTWIGQLLSEDNRRQLWIPAGFAHGFLAMSETAELQYKTTAHFSAEHDCAIRWDDPTISIDWPLEGATPLLGGKDAMAPTLTEAEVFE